MNEMIKKPLLAERWFSGRAFVGLNAALHGTPDEVLEKEGAFMSALVLALLDRQRDGTLPDPGLWGFYATCQRHLAKSQSQILQDLWVIHMLRSKRGGYFVEFGGCDGLYLSNTALLERDYGWTGILAEPDPVWHGDLADNRACAVDHRCVAPLGGQSARFRRVAGTPELSRMARIVPDDVHERSGNRAEYDEIDVTTVTLNGLLSDHNAPYEIDYLSIDTEGSEYEILRSFDFSAHRIALITVEHAGEAAKRDKIRHLLEAQGYRHWRPELTRWDDWYVLKD